MHASMRTCYSYMCICNVDDRNEIATIMVSIVIMQFDETLKRIPVNELLTVMRIMMTMCNDDNKLVIVR